MSEHGVGGRVPREVRSKGNHPERVHKPTQGFNRKSVVQAEGQIGAFEPVVQSNTIPDVAVTPARVPETERAPWFKAGTRYFRQIPHTRVQYETWGARLPFDMQVPLSSKSIKDDQTITPRHGFATVYVLGEVTSVDDKDKFRWVDLNGKGRTVDDDSPAVID